LLLPIKSPIPHSNPLFKELAIWSMNQLPVCTNNIN